MPLGHPSDVGIDTRDTEALIESNIERVSKIVEQLMEAVADTNVRVSWLQGGQDDMALKVLEVTEKVAELTTRLAVAESEEASSRRVVAETVHAIGQLQHEVAMTIARAPAPPPLAADAIADYDRLADPSKASGRALWIVTWPSNSSRASRRRQDCGTSSARLRRHVPFRSSTWCSSPGSRRASQGVMAALMDGADARVCRRVAREMRRCAPAWSEYRVERSAKYLGVQTGLRAGGVQRAGVVARGR